MKPSQPTESGRTYWRSLEELADTPEFREWAQREFPAGASEWSDPVSRRHFVQIMSASFLLAGLGFAGSGCRRPVEKIEPFAKMPEHYLHGVPQYYATAMPAHGSALPLIVKSHDGRPVKIEGNVLHPDSNGGTDRFAQASILNLYDPDRAARFTCKGQNATAEGAMDFLAQLARNSGTNKGAGLAFLLERSNSPSRLRLQKLLQEKCPEAQWYSHEPVDLQVHERAASLAFGQPVTPSFRFEQADVVVALDCDFLGSEPELHNNIRRFAQRRHLEKPTDPLNRLYVAECLMSITGFAADHRLRLASTTLLPLAVALAAELLKPGEVPGLDNLPKPAGVDPKWITECAKDLREHAGRSLVIAGHRQPLAVHLLAYAINGALQNLGKTVVFHAAPKLPERDLQALVQALNGGKVETLVVLGSNPAYTGPAELDFAAALGKAKTVVRLGHQEDETFPYCTWHLPAAHYLESWGDARTGDGTVVPIQPLIAPLFGGLTELELLARIAGANVTDPYGIVRETFATYVKPAEFEEAWKRFLHDGFLKDTAAQPVAVTLNDRSLADSLGAAKLTTPSKDNLEIVFHRDYSLDDGRYNNNGWLQELPDPVTKVVWDNVVLISRKTARDLGVENGDLVEVVLGGRKARGPIWIQPGQADYCLGLALGYGREKSGRVGRGVGFNAYALRTSAAQNFALGGTLRKLGENYPVACTQTHWSMESRPIIREANIQQYREHPDFAKRMKLEEPPNAAPLYPNPLEELKKKGLHQWGMSIDLNKCVGCEACMLACQSENNVPIVGKEQVKRGREMHWLRLDRYYAGPSEKGDFRQKYEKDEDQQFQSWIDNPQTVTQPMLCQHCEAAPCENVCPVNATSHDQEGLNVMTYNRCVGTRYCSNNCPYKVRRFNFFDYNKRPLDQLYLGPFGRRKDDEWDLLKMVKNPEVTVRMRGVMEKCTFCLQRIEAAKITRKVQAGASGDVVVPDGTFTTACAQACPANAIVFGNLNDPESRVSKLKALDRDYQVLEFLFTRPRTTYLARVRNPNPSMPDYSEAPLTFENYEKEMGNPFEEEGKRPVHEPAAPAHSDVKGVR